MVLAVNAYSMNGGSSAGTSQTLSITTTVVNTVLVLLCWNQSYGITSITDGTLPTWQRRFRQPDGTSGYVEEWWTVAAAILTAHTFTVNYGGSVGYWGATPLAISGANTSAPFDTNAAVPTGETGGNTANVVSTTAANTILISIFECNDQGGPSTPSGWMQIQNSNYTSTQYLIESSPLTSFTCAMPSNSTNHSSLVDAIVAAGGVTAAYIAGRSDGSAHGRGSIAGAAATAGRSIGFGRGQGALVASAVLAGRSAGSARARGAAASAGVLAGRGIAVGQGRGANAANTTLAAVAGRGAGAAQGRGAVAASGSIAGRGSGASQGRDAPAAAARVAGHGGGAAHGRAVATAIASVAARTIATAQGRAASMANALFGVLVGRGAAATKGRAASHAPAFTTNFAGRARAALFGRGGLFSYIVRPHPVPIPPPLPPAVRTANAARSNRETAVGSSPRDVTVPSIRRRTDT